MTDVLFYGDTERSYAMRHELPILIGDPFLLGIISGRLHIMVSPLEPPGSRRSPPMRCTTTCPTSASRSCARAMKMHQLDLELVSKAAAAMGVAEAVVDPEMPVAVADRLRADGIVLRPDHDAVASRRRVKSPAELAGIRRAQAAAESGMRAAAELLAQAVPAGKELLHAGSR